MTKVKIYRDKNNKIIKYVISGHTGYGVAGNDIVCAAVSVLGQTALISLDKVCQIDVKDIIYGVDEKKGLLTVELGKNIGESKLVKANVVLETMLVGIESVIESYPGFVTLEYGEV